jgi:rhodanese-related sulfurtransferase
MFNISSPNVPQIDASDVKKAIDTKADVFLLDVRTPQEFAKGNIAGSRNLPVDEVQNKVEKLLPDKSKTIYVYCLSGSRSVHAVAAMVKLGYKNVYDMRSGLLAWRVKGYTTQ